MFPDRPAFSDQSGAVGHFSTSLEAEFYHAPEGRSWEILVAPFFRVDGIDSHRTHADLRECWWRWTADSWTAKVGLGEVFWGVTESIHLVNAINQTDLTEDIDGEEKLGQPMFHLSLDLAPGTLEFFALPYFRERTFPSARGRFLYGIPVDTDHPTFEASQRNWHPDMAVRYSRQWGALDLAVSHFYGTSREPLLQPNATGTHLSPHYPLIHQSGLELQYTTENCLWKLEGFVRSGQEESPFWAGAGGLEYTFHDVAGTGMDLGVIVEYLHDTRENEWLAPFADDLFLGVRAGMNDRLDTSILAGVYLDREDHSTLAVIEAKRRLNDDWTVDLEGRFFANVAEENPLNFFANDSYVGLRFRRAF